MPRWFGAVAIAAVGVLLGVSIWLGARHLAPSGAPPDPLALELRRFRKMTDEDERVDAIRRFGPVRDPRVTVALMEVVQEEVAHNRHGGLLMLASSTVVYHHMPKEEILPEKYWTCARRWWENNEVEVRRRAAALPR
jgi:hypothetical protein